MEIELGIFDYYLIIVNILGFILFGVNTLLYTFTEKGQIDIVLTITSILGGSLGILIAILIIDRKAEKGNMMSRVFVICIFVIQVVAFLMIKGYHTDNITFAFWNFFNEHKILIVYWGIINFVTFAAFAVDKVNAAEHRSRIRIVTLLGLAFIGGSLGGLLAMYLLHHKTKKDYFTVGIRLIIIMQIVVVFYLMNVGW